MSWTTAFIYDADNSELLVVRYEGIRTEMEIAQMISKKFDYFSTRDEYKTVELDNINMHLHCVQLGQMSVRDENDCQILTFSHDDFVGLGVWLDEKYPEFEEDDEEEEDDDE